MLMQFVQRLLRLFRRKGKYAEDYFGVCPHCHRQYGYLNVGRNHWFFCDAHQTCWCIGSNLFSSWHDETKDQWEKNAKKLHGYQIVEPFYGDAAFEGEREVEFVNAAKQPF